MKRLITLIMTGVSMSIVALAQVVQLPHIETAGNTAQLIVDGKPFLMLAGELHNSSASNAEYMRPVWEKLAKLKLNTVIGTASWELIEPQEGQFNFRSVDDEVAGAREHGMKLVLIWFGAWKSTTFCYAPLWVKQDALRFPRTKTRSGEQKTLWGMTFQSISPFGENIVAADARAFRALMHHLRETDKEHTVILVQVENEPGMFGDSRDRSTMAEAAWTGPVPADLLKYMAEHRESLTPELTKLWGAQGSKPNGTWEQVFGSDSAAEEVFMAWYSARAIERIAEAGKQELALPMFTNGWLGPLPEMPKPGMYPSGGPVAGMLDVWHAGAPSLSFVSPNAYAPDFQGVCARYARPDNPLFIPETYPSVANLFWAIGKHSALGYSPFGIDDLPHLEALGAAYELLGALGPMLMKQARDGSVIAVLQGQDASVKEFEQFTGLSVRFGDGHPGPQTGAGEPQPADKKDANQPPPAALFAPSGAEDPRGFALVIRTAPNEFLIAGSGVTVVRSRVELGAVDELLVQNGKLLPGRRLNGDETETGNIVRFDTQNLEVRKLVTYVQH